jgi:hypothetical protein
LRHVNQARALAVKDGNEHGGESEEETQGASTHDRVALSRRDAQ